MHAYRIFHPGVVPGDMARLVRHEKDPAGLDGCVALKSAHSEREREVDEGRGKGGLLMYLCLG